jgi:hypothetical protein
MPTTFPAPLLKVSQQRVPEAFQWMTSTLGGTNLECHVAPISVQCIPLAKGSDDLLPSWNDRPTRQAIERFVTSVTTAGEPGYVPPEARAAVFDNDGTLWYEKPLPIQANVLPRRIGEMAQHNPALRERQPWKAVAAKDYTWLSGAISKHYHGDNRDLMEKAAGLLAAGPS